MLLSNLSTFLVAWVEMLDKSLTQPFEKCSSILLARKEITLQHIEDI